MRYKRRDNGTVAVLWDETDGERQRAHLERLRWLKRDGTKGVLEESGGWPAPLGMTPMRHQVETSDFLVLHPRACVLDDTGTGKTYAVSWSVWRLFEMGRVRKVGIVCPKSTLHTVWERTLASVFLGNRKITVKDVSGDVVIGNVDWWKSVKAGTYDLLVVDEATMIKNTTTQRFKGLYKLGRDAMVWLLTATPMAQSPMDAHGIARMLGTTTEGKGLWRDRTMFQVSRFKWEPRRAAQEIVQPFLEPAIRHAKADCLDLPPITYTRREVALTADQKRLLQTLKAQYRLEINQATVTAANEAVLRTKFLQILCGIVYSDQGVEQVESERMDVIDEIVAESADPVLVFGIFKGLTFHWTPAYSSGVINGDTPDKERVRLIDAFQSGEIRALMAHPATIGHGVTLTRGSTVVWATPTDSAELFYQGNSRLHRKGQTNAVTVVELVSHPLEEHIFDRLEKMGSLQGLLLEMFEED